MKNAVEGFLKSNPVSLDLAARYLRKVRDFIVSGSVIEEAFGKALPTLSIPLDKSYFQQIKNPEQSSRPWVTAFSRVVEDRGGVVNGMLGEEALKADNLQSNLAGLRDLIAGRKDLQQLFEKAAANPADRTAMEPLLNLDWEDDYLGSFLTQKPKAEKKHLSEFTREILQGTMPSGTTEDEKKSRAVEKYIADLENREKQKKFQATEADIDFFNTNWSHVKTSPALLRQWERFIYPDKIESSDFSSALLRAVYVLFSPDARKAEAPVQKRICISFQAKQHKSCTEKLSPSMMRYFNQTYRDLRALLGDSVIWHTDFMKGWPDPLLDWSGWVGRAKIDENRLEKGEGAWELRLLVSEADEQGQPKKDKKITLQWKFAGNSLPCRQTEFISALSKEPVCQLTTAPANDLGKCGVFRLVSLTQVDTLSKGAPTVVNIDKIIREQISARPDDISAAFQAAYEDFRKTYRKALDELPVKGFDFDNASAVLNSYTALLKQAADLTDSEKNRNEVLGPLMAVGTLRCEVGNTFFEVLPLWHPMRMFEIARQHREAADAISAVLRGNQAVGIGHEFPRLLEDEAAVPTMPPMAVSLDKGLLSGRKTALPIEHCHWYSLCARDRADDAEQIRSDAVSAKLAAGELAQALQAYQDIEEIPDSGAKLLSVEAETSQTAPLLCVKAKEFLAEKPSALTFQNQDFKSVSWIYNTLAELSDQNPEATAGLRCSVFKGALKELMKQLPSAADNTVRPYHLALIDKLSAREAEFKWVQISNPQIGDKLTAKPILVDRRRVDFDEDSMAQIYTVYPEFTECTALYLRHVYRIAEAAKSGYAYQSNTLYVPVREVRADDREGNLLGEALANAHRLADWVVTYDSMLSKRQIAGGRNLIVRHKHGTNGNAGTIISSSSSADSLLGKLTQRINGDFGNDLNDAERAAAVNNLHREALCISGYIGLRAAKQDNSAGELIGLCLSKAVIEDTFIEECQRRGETMHFTAFLMLDDYASWFCKDAPNRTIADIIAFCVAETAKGTTALHVIVSECKYCKSLDDQERSRRQLETTLSKLSSALLKTKEGPEKSYSVRVWHNRIANMLLDADIADRKVGTGDFYKDLSLIRKGEFELTLNGYSHYFGYTEPASPEPVAYGLGELTYYQQVFGKDLILKMIRSLPAEAKKAPGMPSGLLKEACTVGAKATEAYRFAQVNMLTAADVIDTQENGSGGASGGEGSDLSSDSGAALTSVSDAVPKEAAVQSVDIAVTAQELSGGTASLDNPAVSVLVSDTDQTASGVPERTLPAGMYGQAVGSLILKEARPLRYSADRIDWCAEMAKQLRFGLNDNKISVQEIRHIPTPNGCLVVYQGNRDLGVGVIDSLKEQLLMTRRLRIIFSEAAAGEFRVFIESPTREIVSMWNMWLDREARRNKDGTNTSLVLGLKEADGSILYLDPMSPENDPHTLIAGGTGSGKSVLVQTLLADIVVTNPSELCRIYIIDTKKGVNYAPFRQLSHLAAPVMCSVK